jgi:hypothetical protein
VVQGKQEQKSWQDFISKNKLGVMEHTYNSSNKGSGNRRIMYLKQKHKTLLEK